MSVLRRMLAVAAVVWLSLLHAPVSAQETSPGACAAIDDTMQTSLVDALHGATLDPAKAGSMMEDNVVYTSPLMGVVTGRDPVVAALTKLSQSLTGLSLKASDVLVDAPYVVVRYTLSGKQEGELEGMPASGNDVSVTGTAVYRLHCGMVSEAWTQFDQLGMMAQMDDRYAAFAPSAEMPSPTETASCPAPTTEDTETLVRQMYTEAWTRTPDFPAVLDENVVLHSALGPDIVGIAAVEPLRKNYFTAFPDLSYRHGEIAVDGDLAAAMWTATGTDEGGFMKEAPTGKPIVLDGISIYRVQCGKIVEIWSESDLAGVLRQLGVDGLSS